MMFMTLPVSFISPSERRITLATSDFVPAPPLVSMIIVEAVIVVLAVKTGALLRRRLKEKPAAFTVPPSVRISALL